MLQEGHPARCSVCGQVGACSLPLGDKEHEGIRVPMGLSWGCPTALWILADCSRPWLCPEKLKLAKMQVEKAIKVRACSCPRLSPIFTWHKG